MFEGREINPFPTCAKFITMNPGYAGRTELHDNLKALFRPIATMVPDYKLIAEVIPYSEYLESSKTLARNMTQMYKLCSEQLSQQDRCDLGVLALESLLVVASALERRNFDEGEDVVLVRGLRDANLPRLFGNDAVLLGAVLRDLLPFVELPERDCYLLEAEFRSVLGERKLRRLGDRVSGVIGFCGAMVVRHGVVLVWLTGGGGTAVRRAMAEVTRGFASSPLVVWSMYYRSVRACVLNPRTVTMGGLCSEVSGLALGFRDGLLPSILRACCLDAFEDHHLIVRDSPVCAFWIDNVNLVLGDEWLCLPDSDYIEFAPFLRLVFGVADPAVASPATVSWWDVACPGPAYPRWRPCVRTVLSEQAAELRFEALEHGQSLLARYLGGGVHIANEGCIRLIAQVPFAEVVALWRLLGEVLFGCWPPAGSLDVNLLGTDLQGLRPLDCAAFIFCCLWAVGGNIAGVCFGAFGGFFRRRLGDSGDASVPQGGYLWRCYMDLGARLMGGWERAIPLFCCDEDVPFFRVLVQVIDAVRCGFLFSSVARTVGSVLFAGGTGGGRSVEASSGRGRELVEGKRQKRRESLVNAPVVDQIILFVGDLDMPKLDRYGARPPIGLLRPVQDFCGVCESDELFWEGVRGVTSCAPCAPPGGGRNAVMPRLTHHYSMFCLLAPSEHTLKQMFTAILQSFLAEFPPALRQLGESVVSAAIEVYRRISVDFLPKQTKSHYVLNLHDLSKCVLGVLKGIPGPIREPKHLHRLFFHAAKRVFNDRLVMDKDKLTFYAISAEMSGKYIGENLEPSFFVQTPLLFGDFIKIGAAPEDQLYEDLSAKTKKLQAVLRDYLDDHNMAYSKEVKLLFSIDALQHVCRLYRMLRQDRGNALLVCVSGCGKQNLTRLAAHINGMTSFQIEFTRHYNVDSFHDDLMKLYNLCGQQNKPAVFLLIDTRIVQERFLEDVDNILNSREVPNLFAPDEYELLIVACRPAAGPAGIAEGNCDAIFAFCVNHVRQNQRVVLAMSLVGMSFRSPCRQFPSLVNCCTVDWLTDWPAVALLSAASNLFESVDIGTEQLKPRIADLRVFMHISVARVSQRFYAELKRRYYTTPTSYLELITLYVSMPQEKKKQLTSACDRVKNGLTKLLESNQLVATMEKELVAPEPVLKPKSIDTNNLMKKLAVDQRRTDQVRRVVREDEAVANVKAEETKAIADKVQRDLDLALPAPEALYTNDIAELRVFAEPLELVQTVMVAECLLLGSKPDWASARVVLTDSSFLSALCEFDNDGAKGGANKRLQEFVGNPVFAPVRVERVSKACRSVCLWVRTINAFAHDARTVPPKRKRLEGAQRELAFVVAVLTEERSRLKAVMIQIAELRRHCDETVDKKRRLEHKMQLTRALLDRAGRLITSLGKKQMRWIASFAEFEAPLGSVTGDVFLAAASIAYCVASASDRRSALVRL